MERHSTTSSEVKPMEEFANGIGFGSRKLHGFRFALPVATFLRPSGAFRWQSVPVSLRAFTRLKGYKSFTTFSAVFGDSCIMVSLARRIAFLALGCPCV